MTPSREVRSTPEEAADLANLMARLAAIAALDPALAASELRPLVESLEARRRKCDRPGCGLPFLRRRQAIRGRDFCGSGCRVTAFRQRYRAG